MTQDDGFRPRGFDTTIVILWLKRKTEINIPINVF